MNSALKILLAAALVVPLPGQDEPAADAPAADPPVAPEDDGTRVAILGYHEFSKTAAETEMLIRTSKFRRQLEVIGELGLTVISMDQFTRWKRGELDLPARCVMITIDDGWKAVYTDAFPILREFGHPFTLFLYKNYVAGGGKALTNGMIREMMKHGATIGSHSVSHPYPAEVKKVRARDLGAFQRFLRTEMGESKRFLEMTFGTRVPIYAYPGGYFTDDMFPIAAEIGYQYLFTVQPAKVTRSSPDRALPRYMILGTHDRIFEIATDFSNTPSQPAGVIAGLTRETTLPVVPPAGSLVNDRLPRLEVDFSSADDLDPASVVMKVGGFGTVPATFDETTRRLSWTINRPLRQRFCHVLVNWKNDQGEPPERPLKWSFQIDRNSAYLPEK
jgi:peptidoglycan/xylan/chitin deacetylase (PgdA/CDA1 family)